MTTVAKSVLLNVAAGNADAVADCIDRFGNLVWSLAQKFSHSTAEAEIATQEIFTEIWNNAHNYQQAKCSERVFVAMLARRRLLHRKRNLGYSFDQNVDVIAPLHSLDSMIENREVCEESRLIMAELGKLPVDQAKAVLLAVHHGLPSSGISKLTGIAEETVKSQLWIGLSRLRESVSVSWLRPRS